MKTTKMINADREAWERIRSKFPGMSDSKRTRILDTLFDEVVSINIVGKLKPELTDSKQDRLMKKLLGEVFNAKR